MNLTIETVEKFLYPLYLEHHKARSRAVVRPDGKRVELDYLRLELLSETIPFSLDKVTVKSSPVHGKGVFAVKDIKRGELITFYPGDVVKYRTDKGGYFCAALISKRSKEQLKNKEGDPDYEFGIDDSYSIVGNPSFDEDSSYLGHLINDGAKSNSSAQSDHIYCIIALLKANCSFEPLVGGLHVAVVATKDITIGDELFVPYGPRYWHGHNKRQDLTSFI